MPPFLVNRVVTVPGVANPFIQQYTYDELNRLKIAEETQNSTQKWKQAFTFDRFGNRNFDEANTTTLEKNCGSSPNFEVCAADRKVVNPSINTTNNRFDSGQGYSYDSSGNTTADAEGRTFVYDAENKQVEVIESSVTIGEYFYDGDGKRVKKVVPAGETTVFVYDAGGRLIGEYSTVVQSGLNAKTVYTTNDHLGSPRINTDGVGAVISRHDYHPFGEEIARTGYGSDTIRKQFTGYERDEESALDFAEARYLNVSLGRFTTPDPLRESGRARLPSSWNRYVYVLNNPVNLVDPTGLQDCKANQPCPKNPPPPEVKIVIIEHTTNKERPLNKAEKKVVDDLVKANWPVIYNATVDAVARTNVPKSEVVTTTESESGSGKVNVGNSGVDVEGGGSRGSTATSNTVPSLEDQLNANKTYLNNNAVAVSSAERLGIGNAGEGVAIINTQLRQEATRLVEEANKSPALPNEADQRRRDAIKQYRPQRVGPFPTRPE